MNINFRKLLCILLPFIVPIAIQAQEHELNAGWLCIKADELKAGGEAISKPDFNTKAFMPAAVPGTVLGSLLLNHKIPDPYFGLNNEKIQDIYTTGPAAYTYWFIKDLQEPALAIDEQLWLHLRGVNYSFELYMNGLRINADDKGMFLRHSFNISKFRNKDGHDRIAILVHPPQPVGNGNGGQGGDGMIAHSVTNQYVAGWDWIQPIRDRNTGIWDKVSICKTGEVRILDPHIITKVPGVRSTKGKQEPASLFINTELENSSDIALEGYLQCEVDGKTVAQSAFIPAHGHCMVNLKPIIITDPKLWWPNGYGAQNLYGLKLKFTIANHTLASDIKDLQFGIRELEARWNKETNSRELRVNGKKIFIKGANWITSDALLQLSRERYDAQIRFHQLMNLNLIRVWGGAITERPEFYEACDKYGLMVFQEFWISGDCNGRWYDKMKKEDTLTRRTYPDDHALFISSAADQIKLLRNHPSLVFWCGGNEILPPADLLHALKDSLLPNLDGTRYCFNYSNDDSMSLHSGDGPYVLQDPNYFWDHRSFPFNSEIGSVGIGDLTSLERFLPAEALHIPETLGKKGSIDIDPIWKYHKYISYGKAIDAYGKAKNLEDFANKAQLINYMQYKSLAEGFGSHAWAWYTGYIIWKTSNPWTALLGEMYDHYLDPNACLYGTARGSEPFHIMFCPSDSTLMITNQTDTTVPNFTLVAKAYDISGKETILGVIHAESQPGKIMKALPLRLELRNILKQSLQHADFLRLEALDYHQNCIANNFYWLPDAANMFLRLHDMPTAQLEISVEAISRGKIKIKLENAKNKPVAFFNRLSVVDATTKQRVLPVFYTDNYISVCPGETKYVELEYPANNTADLKLCIEGWNYKKKYFAIP